MTTYLSRDNLIRARMSGSASSAGLTPPGPPGASGSAPKATSILNILPARILSQTPTGRNEILVVLSLTADSGSARLLARITRRSSEQLGLAEGMPVFAQVKGVSLALK